VHGARCTAKKSAKKIPENLKNNTKLPKMGVPHNFIFVDKPNLEKIKRKALIGHSNTFNKTNF